jgi:hypothetical protein
LPHFLSFRISSFLFLSNHSWSCSLPAWRRLDYLLFSFDLLGQDLLWEIAFCAKAPEVTCSFFSVLSVPFFNVVAVVWKDGGNSKLTVFRWWSELFWWFRI